MGRNKSTESETSQDEVELGGEGTGGTGKMSQAVNGDSVPSSVHDGASVTRGRALCECSW